MFRIPFLTVPPSTFDSMVGGRFELCSIFADNRIVANFGSPPEDLSVFCDNGDTVTVEGKAIRAALDTIVADYLKWQADQEVMASEAAKQPESEQVPLPFDPSDCPF